MLTYPQINPIALEIGPLKIHWYGLMYVLGFLTAWGLALLRAKRSVVWTSEQVGDLIFYGALGVVLGGRLGYMIFYNLPQLLADPLSLFKVWDGGMSFHGGLLGVAVALYIFCRKYNKTYFETADFIAPLVPIGLGLGRLGNFINGELWGRVTTVSWGMVFPRAGSLPRHPSQLYELLLEGVLLFTIVWFFSAKPRPKMSVSGLFLVVYGLFRIIAEAFRQPDPQYGFLAFGWLTMGQILSLPMIIVGIIMLIYAYKERAHEAIH